MYRYAPNIWKTFLLYAQDLVGRSSNLNLPFPEAAKCSEKVLYSLPFGINFDKEDVEYATSFMLSDKGVSKFSTDTAFIMTKSACIKFARDYGLVPYLMTRKQFKEAFSKVNRPKNSVVKATPTTAPVAASVFTKSYNPVSPFKPQVDNKSLHPRGMHFGGKDSGKTVYRPFTFSSFIFPVFVINNYFFYLNYAAEILDI
jgi:hypothetical protein